MKSGLSLKVFFILLGLNVFSVLAIFPYILTVQGALLEQTGQPLNLILLVQFVQSVLLFSVACYIGLHLLKKIQFQLPLLEAITQGKEYKTILKDISRLSLLLGMSTAIGIYLVDYVFSLLGATISTSQIRAPAWQTLLASFYGGIAEETLMRLFLMSFFIWIGTTITRQIRPNQRVIWPSIVLAAIIFGLGHLPITASLTHITPVIVTRAIILNGMGGIVFGWLYWKKGLEAAMIAHFTTDIFLLTIIPRIVGYAS